MPSSPLSRRVWSDVDGTSCGFRKAFRLDAEAAVEACTEVLPRNLRGQLDHLLRVEVLTKALEQLLRNIGRRQRECDRVTQDLLLQLGERWAFLEGGQVCYFP